MAKLHDVRIALAYSLDPRFHRKHLTQQHRTDIAKYVLGRSADLDTQYYLFQDLLNDDFAGHDQERILWDRSGGDVIRFWTRLSGLGDEWKAVSEEALRLLSVVCNSASAERVWSYFSFIHSKNRNRLTTERTIQLALTYAWKQSQQSAKPVTFAPTTFSIFAPMEDDDEPPVVPPLSDVDGSAGQPDSESGSTFVGLFEGSGWMAVRGVEVSEESKQECL